jgi:hypothetical protein
MEISRGSARRSRAPPPDTVAHLGHRPGGAADACASVTFPCPAGQRPLRRLFPGVARRCAALALG